MKHAANVACLVFACLALPSCRPAAESLTAPESHTAAEPLTVEIPQGLVAVTDAQKQLITSLKTLARNMSPQEAKRKLGSPTEETPDTLFYHVVEDEREGGYSVTATLTFENGELTSAAVEHGHESRSPAD